MTERHVRWLLINLSCPGAGGRDGLIVSTGDKGDFTEFPLLVGGKGFVEGMAAQSNFSCY